MSVVVGLLGPVTVSATADAAAVAPGTRGRVLLAALALTPGQPVSTDRLIDFMWADDPPGSPTAALQTQVSRLRRLLPGRALQPTPGGYRLALDREHIDLYAATDLAAIGDADSLHRAAEMFRGEPGADLVDGPVADQLRRTAGRLRADIDDRLSQVALRDHDFATAIRLAQTRVEADHLDETAAATLMEGLAGAGRTSEALMVFVRLRRALSEELGVDPGPRVTALNATILGHQQLSETPTPAPTNPTPTHLQRERAAVGLRLEPNPLLGRAADIAHVRGLVSTARVVTIQAPGGAGKTRLATTVGASLAETRSVYFVELAPVRDAAGVLAAIASAVEVAEYEVLADGRRRPVSSDLRTTLFSTLAARTAVLILDNCEQAVDDVAELVDDMIARAPGVTVITTSRSPLLIGPESVYPLPALTIDADGSPATDLFAARARAIRPDVVLPPATVAALCTQLDGLPLAIELAAARVRTMSVEDILVGLSQRFTLLRGGSRAAPQRHRTLQAVIEWSWQLLDTPSQSALARMSLFPSGFGRDAAQAVLRGSARPLIDDALEQLVNQSLLNVAEVDGETRYRMLETVREFGEQQLRTETNPEDFTEVVAAMGDWACEFATIAMRAQHNHTVDAALLRRVHREAPNLAWVMGQALQNAVPPAQQRVICHCFTALTGLWLLRGANNELVSWINRVAPALTEGQARARGSEDAETYQLTLIIVMCYLAAEAGDVRAAARLRSWLRRSVGRDAVSTRVVEYAAALLTTPNRAAAWSLLSRGAHSTVPEIRWVSLGMRSNLWENSGNIRGSTRDAHDGLAVAISLGDSWGIASAHSHIASLYGQRGEYTTAATHYRASLRSLTELEMTEEARQIGGYLAVCLAANGQAAQARKTLTEAAAGWDPSTLTVPPGDPELSSGLLAAAAECVLAEGDCTQGSALHELAMTTVMSVAVTQRRGPSWAMILGAGVCGLVRCGQPHRAEPFVGGLVQVIRELATAGQFGADTPVAGTAAVGIGAFVATTDPTAGARLVTIGRALGARQDHPSVRLILTQYPHTHQAAAHKRRSLIAELGSIVEGLPY